MRLEQPVLVYIKTIVRLYFKSLLSELYLSKKGRPSLLQLIKNIHECVYIKQHEIKMYKNGIKVGTSKKYADK
jgi:hypothetical protein